MKNKILSLICVIAILFSAIASTGYAKNESLKFELQALGVLDGINSENEGGFTRGEFSKIITNVIGYYFNTDESISGNYFTDISGSEYRDSVNTLCALGIVSGDGSSQFYPENKIRINEVLKMLVNALGYGAVMSDKSLNAYRDKAVSLGLLKGTSSSAEYPDKESVYIILNNALDVNALFDAHYKGKGDVFERGESLRDMLTKKTHYEIQQLRGTITADKAVYLKNKVTNMDDNEIEIEGKLYKFGASLPSGLVGMTIDFFQRIDSDGSEEVLAWKISKFNTVAEFNTKDILGIDGNMIKTKKDRVKLVENTYYLYNGRPETGWSAEKINALDNASFRAIDNDNDGFSEVIYIWQYENRVVERVNVSSKLVVLKDDFKNPMKYLSLDIEDKELSTNILAADGTVLELEAIKPEMVISIAISRDNESVTAVLCDSIAEGTLEMTDEDFITVDGKEYPYDIDLSKLKLGKSVKLFLNFEGTAVYFESETEKNYGYVYAFGGGTGVKSTGEIKMILAGPVATRYREVEDLESGGEATTTPELYARNEGVEVFKLSDKVRVNGEKTALRDLEAKILHQPVAYTLDNEGRVKSVDILEPVDPTMKQKYYNANEQIFGGLGTTAFGITSEDSLSVCLPGIENLHTNLFTVDPDASDDDLLVYTKLSSGSNVRYTVSGFEVDEDSHIAELIVITSSMNADIADTAGASSEVGLVGGVRNIITDDGSDLLEVKMIYEGEEKKYYVNDLSPSIGKFADLKVGDLIVFTVDGFDKLSDCRVIQSADNYNDFVLGENTEYERFCGIVTGFEYNVPSVTKNRWVHRYTLSFSDGSYVTPTPYDVFARGTTPVFILEGGKVVKSGAYDDVLYGERVFFSVNNGNVRAIVVDRRGR